MLLRILLLAISLPLLSGCHVEGNNASTFTSLRGDSPDAVVVLGLSMDTQQWLFSGITLVRLDSTTGQPSTLPNATVKFGRSDGQNLRQKKPTYIVVKVQPGRYALANYFVGSQDAKRREIRRIVGRTRAYEIKPGQVNYIGNFRIDVVRVDWRAALRREIVKRVALAGVGYDADAAKLALKSYSDIRAPFTIVKAEMTRLE